MSETRINANIDVIQLSADLSSVQLAAEIAGPFAGTVSDGVTRGRLNKALSALTLTGTGTVAAGGPAGFTYRQPGGIDTYHRTDGTSYFLRP